MTPAAAVQRQKAVSAYFTSKQILPFAIAEQCCTRSDLSVPFGPGPNLYAPIETCALEASRPPIGTFWGRPMRSSLEKEPIF